MSHSVLFLNLSSGLSDRADREEAPAHLRLLRHGLVFQPTYSLPQFPGKPQVFLLLTDLLSCTIQLTVPLSTAALCWLYAHGMSSIFSSTPFRGCPTSATSASWLWSPPSALDQVGQHINRAYTNLLSLRKNCFTSLATSNIQIYSLKISGRATGFLFLYF